MGIFSKAAAALLILLLIVLTVRSKTSSAVSTPRARWVDSVYGRLTQEERIGQLFMVAAYSGGKGQNQEQIEKLVSARQVGGLIFMQGGPVRQALLTNRYQRMAQVPLLISMDAEWGLGMRLDSVRNLPRQMMLGATRDTALAYRTGAAIAAQCRLLGVHIDFAPDVDVNNNAANPVINSRSYGEDKHWVARMGVAYMRGLQDNGVIACAKHFPGHGNTSVDSHKDLPLIPRSLAQLDTLELYPFKQLVAAGVKSVMVGHLDVPALDTAAHVPATLSHNAVTGLLIDRLGFDGLVITDALGMQGVTKYFPNGETDLRAFEAGNDILLFTQDVPVALARIKGAMDSGRISPARLEASVKKILAAKYDAGLASWKDIPTDNLTAQLNKDIDPIRMQAAREAITLVRDDNQVLKKINRNMAIGYIGIDAGSDHPPLYAGLHDAYPLMRSAWLTKTTPADSARMLLDSMAGNDAVVIAVHNISFTPGNNYGLHDSLPVFLREAATRKNVLIVLLGNAYAMQYVCNAPSVMVTYEDDSLTELAAAAVLLKNAKAGGALPVTACNAGQDTARSAAGPSLAAAPAQELVKVWDPAAAGVIDPTALNRLDMFMARNIADGVFPGCRVLAARDGKVFYDKAFGYLKYDKKRAVDTNTLYDMASCTKVLATLPAIMRLYEDGKIDLDKTIGDYLPAARGTNKAGLHLRDLLLHQAGLKSWVPFYKETLDEDGDLKTSLYKKKAKGDYTIPVAKNLYLRKDYIDTIWKRIYDSPLDNPGKMVYSDLDFYFLAEIVKQVTGRRIDKYADEEFYKPMGLKRITYNPLKKFDTLKMAPTEIDGNFRDQLVYGYVHDPGAAMLGGVAGHAGLFATAHDVAAMFQLYLDKGVYGGRRYFKESTIAYFTPYSSPISHRALGFDKPLPDADNGGAAGDRCSGYAFGHQGFTGTCAWADPATGVVFVFLSNRVYPSATNTKINKLSVRTISQDLIYESLGIPVNHVRGVIYKEEVSKK